MSQYGVFQAIFMSFYSPSLYRDVARRWGGCVFWYLFVLMGIVSALYASQAAVLMNSHFPDFSARYLTQFPVMTYTNGKLSTPENRPYEIVDPASHEPLMVIDASGQYTSLDQTKAGVLVTQSDIISRTGKTDSRTMHMSDSLNTSIDLMTLGQKFQPYAWSVWFIVFPLCLLFLFLFRLIQAFLYAIIGKCFSLVTLVSLTYFQVFQITVVAFTPAVVAEMIVDYSGAIIPHVHLIYFLVCMFFLLFGILSNKTND